MKSVVLSIQNIEDSGIEIVERKGLGHPDTICDALAENLSRTLCREYSAEVRAHSPPQRRQGVVVRRRAAPAFGGGTILAPINIHSPVARRRVVDGESIAVEELAVQSSRPAARQPACGWIRSAECASHPLIWPGSQDPRELFSRGNIPWPTTLRSASHAPLSGWSGWCSPLNAASTQQIEAGSNRRGRGRQGHGIRQGDAVQLTVARAMIGRYLRHIDDYLAEKLKIENLAA
jgi:S-adenosylmethionine synthetase